MRSLGCGVWAGGCVAVAWETLRVFRCCYAALGWRWFFSKMTSGYREKGVFWWFLFGKYPSTCFEKVFKSISTEFKAKKEKAK
jgi:hypothetical protein